MSLPALGGPGSEDLVRGIRAAHLGSLRHVARRHGDMLRRLHVSHHEPGDRPFAARLAVILADGLEAWHRPGSELDLATLAPLLGDLLRPGPAIGRAARAEAIVLARLEDEAGLPSTGFFRECFRQDGGWRDALVLFLAERLRNDALLRAHLLPTR